MGSTDTSGTDRRRLLPVVTRRPFTMPGKGGRATGGVLAADGVPGRGPWQHAEVARGLSPGLSRCRLHGQDGEVRRTAPARLECGALIRAGHSVRVRGG